MKPMTSPTVETVDLLDLKLLPAWVKEPAEARSYARYTGDEGSGRQKAEHDPRRSKSKRRTSNVEGPTLRQDGRHREALRNKTGSSARHWHGPKHRPSPNRDAPVPRTPPVTIHFLAYLPALENVVAQIRSGSVAYSLFALARLFLERPVGYEVCLTARAESPLYQLGDNGVVFVDREFLERNAFRFAQRDFYQIEVVETNPIKGNFSNVARCRLSGTLLGPTNYHNYQPQLRSLYEQRFSRRMSFAEYQRQIVVMSDAELIERWKENARKITTYTTLREASSLKFSSALEAERHFRSHYLPGLIRGVGEATFGGGLSRRLPDRMLNRTIEEAWMNETRSPSNMMQELAGRFRQNGLHIFRHRRGMLFISPIRVRAFVHEQAGVSALVNSILEAVSATAGINRKQLFETLTGNGASENAEPHRLALASDLRWLINEGYVIEFNDGSLDRPRMKSRPQEAVPAEAALSSSSSRLAVEERQLTLATPRALTLYSPQP